MKKAILFTIGFLIITTSLIWLLSKAFLNNKNITNFEECIQAGNPVMESYPRQCRSKAGETFVEEIGNELEKIDLIRVSTPRPGDLIQSPLFILGEAVGPWFFEASFPVVLEDGEGNILAGGVATAEGDWMTEDFVNFKAQLEFVVPQTPTGKLILRKDNPSGLEEFDDSLWIPVEFNKQNLEKNSTTSLLEIYLINNKLSQTKNNDCSEVFSVKREVPKTEGVARAALTELLKGPTSEEEQAGFITSINKGVKIQKIVIKEGVAEVDFSKELNESVAGSCLVTAIRSQIEKTLLQFPTVQTVIISVNGNKETILQP